MLRGDLEGMRGGGMFGGGRGEEGVREESGPGLGDYRALDSPRPTPRATSAHLLPAVTSVSQFSAISPASRTGRPPTTPQTCRPLQPGGKASPDLGDTRPPPPLPRCFVPLCHPHRGP